MTTAEAINLKDIFKDAGIVNRVPTMDYCKKVIQDCGGLSDNDIGDMAIAFDEGYLAGLKAR
jgi:hypothetical protein